MSSRKNWLIAKISSEGYCCLNAYLRLCKARGESVKDMAANIGMSPDALWYHYRKMEGENPPVCQRFSDCMDEVITGIEAASSPATQ